MELFFYDEHCRSTYKDARHNGKENEPEPEEDVDFLVEEVEGESALYGIAVVVAEAADVEVAHGDSGEGDVVAVIPLVIGPHSLHNLQNKYLKNSVQSSCTGS